MGGYDRSEWWVVAVGSVGVGWGGVGCWLNVNGLKRIYKVVYGPQIGGTHPGFRDCKNPATCMYVM